MIHAVYDVTGCTTCNPEPGDLLQAMRHTVHRLGCTVLGELPVLFQPHGATFVLVLAESHLTVSTWPEHQLAHVDLFTCRADTDPEHAIAPILAALGSEKCTVSESTDTAPAASPPPQRRTHDESRYQRQRNRVTQYAATGLPSPPPASITGKPAPHLQTGSLTNHFGVAAVCRS